MPLASRTPLSQSFHFDKINRKNFNQYLLGLVNFLSQNTASLKKSQPPPLFDILPCNAKFFDKMRKNSPFAEFTVSTVTR